MIDRLQDFLSYAVLSASGDVIACAGIVDHWQGRGEVWALYPEAMGVANVRGLLGVYKTVIENSPFDRVEAHCRAGNRQARTILTRCGFSCYAENQQKFYPNGDSADLYAWVRGHHGD